MRQQEKLKYLKVALVVFGIIFIAGIYVMMMWVWPSGWGWTPRQPEYEQMIMGVYATLGVFLIRAAKDPLANASLIWFTIWSSIVHAGIMLVQALVDETERANLLLKGQTCSVTFPLYFWWPLSFGISCPGEPRRKGQPPNRRKSGAVRLQRAFSAQRADASRCLEFSCLLSGCV